jgi:hypothetical protein
MLDGETQLNEKNRDWECVVGSSLILIGRLTSRHPGWIGVSQWVVVHVGVHVEVLRIFNPFHELL